MPAPANLVHEISTSIGTGNFTLSAQNGKQRFSTAFGTGVTLNVFDYFISNQDAAEWERGTGHMSATSTLVRDTVIESTNANAAVNFTAGTKNVTNDVPAAKQVTTEGGKTLTGALTFPNTGLHIRDTGGDNDYIIAPGENATADRTLTINQQDANRTLTLGGNLTLSANVSLNQNLRTTDSPQFVNETLTGFIDITEIAEPAAPAANVARFRSIDDGAGVTTLGMKDAAGNIVPMSHFKQAGTGAVTRTQQTKMREVFSILDFGGVGDGTTDNAAALAAAYAAMVAAGGTGGRIYFPTGKYRFNSSVTLTLPAGLFSVCVEGDGADQTVLYWPSTAGLVIACSNARHSVHVRNMSITTGTANIGSALKLTNSVLLGVIQQSDVTGVTFRGDDGGAVSNYWTTGVDVIGLSMISIVDVLVYGDGTHGNGVSLAGNASVSPNFGIIYNLDRCTFLSLGVGLNYGTDIQGVSVGQCNFTNCTTGIHIPTGAVGTTQLAVTSSQFDCTGGNIFIEAPIAGLMVTNSLFYVASSGFGIVCTSTGFQNAITGNVFAGEVASTSTTGIQTSGNITGSCVVGNTFYNLTVATELGGTATWLVDNNVYDTVTTPLSNLGTNKHGPRFEIGAGGTVTQITNKATAVTLNKRCGQIIMEPTQSIGAFGATGNITFQLVNNQIVRSGNNQDGINVRVVSSTTANAYTAQVVAITNGAANIMVENKTAGALAQAITLGFEVIKATIA